MQTSNRKDQLRFGTPAWAAQVAVGPARDVSDKIARKTAINETMMGGMRVIEEGEHRGLRLDNF
jgi:hypothetical protein